MIVSVFDIYTIGIGPSSSHVVGPMRAARSFVTLLEEKDVLHSVSSVDIELYGSLAYTGKGHGTDRAILLGLMGITPEGVDPDNITGLIGTVRTSREIELAGKQRISFDEERQLRFVTAKTLPAHPNSMRFTAFGSAGQRLTSQLYYSVGGGFVATGTEDKLAPPEGSRVPAPNPFTSSEELLRLCNERGITIAQLVMQNEVRWRSEREVHEGLLNIWKVMQGCVARGLKTEGTLPGGLEIERRAPHIHRELIERPEQALRDPLSILDWVNLYALAVNEENAAGGRVVTAPTNGAAGIVPAVLHYYYHFSPGPDNDGIIRFLLTAGAIAMLYKMNASISGAEVGCQGEVGVACSMAAAGIAAALGGTNEQVENAAEIGMEHNLGLTCDPIGGLVQVPCIERNAMGAVKAINAARIALKGDGFHKVSLDQVIATMRQTGVDMASKYKETSLGGLAVNVPEC